MPFQGSGFGIDGPVRAAAHQRAGGEQIAVRPEALGAFGAHRGLVAFEEEGRIPDDRREIGGDAELAEALDVGGCDVARMRDVMRQAGRAVEAAHHLDCVERLSHRSIARAMDLYAEPVLLTLAKPAD